MADKNEIPTIDAITVTASPTQPAGASTASSPATPGFFSFKWGQQYYTSRSRKWGDIGAGFVLGILLGVLFIFVLSRSQGPYGNSALGSYGVIAAIALYVGALIFFGVTGRRYLNIGLLLTWALPIVFMLLFFGACLLGVIG
jgi:hypothetical protein